MWHCFIPSFFLKSCFLLALWTCLLWLLSSVYFSDNTDIWFLSQVIYVGCFFLPKYMGYILLFLCMYHFLIGYFIYYSNLGLPPPPPPEHVVVYLVTDWIISAKSISLSQSSDSDTPLGGADLGIPESHHGMAVVLVGLSSSLFHAIPLKPN